MASDRTAMGEMEEERGISLSEGHAFSSVVEDKPKRQGVTQQQGKRPDYYGLGLQAEAEKARLSALVAGKAREGVTALCGAMESVLKLTDTAVQRIPGVELSAVEEAAEVVKKNKAILRTEYHFQDLEVIDKIEQTLQIRINDLKNLPAPPLPQR